MAQVKNTRNFKGKQEGRNISSDYRICFLHIGELLAKPHSVSLV